MTDPVTNAVKSAAANVEAATKADVSQARAEERGWIVNHPHETIVIAIIVAVAAFFVGLVL